jgi:hypothetical protein
VLWCRGQTSAHTYIALAAFMACALNAHMRMHAAA